MEGGLAPMENTERQWLTLDEAAEILGYRTTKPILRRIERGDLPVLPRHPYYTIEHYQD